MRCDDCRKNFRVDGGMLAAIIVVIHSALYMKIPMAKNQSLQAAETKFLPELCLTCAGHQIIPPSSGLFGQRKATRPLVGYFKPNRVAPQSVKRIVAVA
jgi:hypothetical protein